MKRFLMLTTSVYTVAVTLLSLFTWFMKRFGEPPQASGAAEETNLKILLLTVLTVAAMLLYERITRDVDAFDRFVGDFAARFMIAYLSSFFGGVWAGIIPFTGWMALLCVVFTFICVLVTYLLTFLTVSEYAETINRQLHTRRKYPKNHR